MTESRPTRGRPRTIDPDKVRDTALSAYLRGDPADVPINAVCRLSGISKPSLYREFGRGEGLTRAAFDSYAERVLSAVFAILNGGGGMREMIGALIDFAAADRRRETGFLLSRMRAGEHRLALVEEPDLAAHATFLHQCRKSGPRRGDLPVASGAADLGEQVAPAVARGASGDDPAPIRNRMGLALMVVHPHGDTS